MTGLQQYVLIFSGRTLIFLIQGMHLIITDFDPHYTMGIITSDYETPVCTGGFLYV